MPLFVDDIPMTAQLLIEVENGDIDVVKELVIILHEVLIDSYEIFSSLSPTETGLKILYGVETDKNYNNYIQTLNEARASLESILLKYGEKNQSENLSKTILRHFFSLLSSMEKDFGAKKICINWDNSIVIIVKFASMKDYEKTINNDRENLIKKVTEVFDRIFENMDRCKGEERQAHHKVHRITINKMESSGYECVFT